MDLSVIIVSYNVRHFLEQCLNSVRKSADGLKSEIFVVDNNSTDGSCSMVCCEFPEVKLISNHMNLGFSTANNQALKLATGSFILLLNPDTIVEEDTFTKCIRFMNENPDAGALGARMINGRGRFLPESKRGFPTPATAFFKMAGFASLFPRSPLFNRYYLGHLDQLKTSRADILSGAFMFLRREAVIKTGFLDEDYFLYGEDVDYSYRLLHSGYNNYYFPEARIVHFKGESTKKEDLNIFINFYKAMLIFVEKHSSNGNSRVFIVALKAAILIRAGISFGERLIKRVVHPVRTFIGANFIPGSSNIVIVSGPEEFPKVKKLISSQGSKKMIAGRVSIRNDDMNEDVLGAVDQIREVIRVNRIREVIFTPGDLSIAQIIDNMHIISDLNVRIRIVAADGKYLIGSRFVIPGEESIIKVQ